MTKTLVKPCDWPRPVVASLTALWDAVDAADAEVCKAVQEDSARQDLKQLQEEFKAARYQLVGFLLDTLAPEPDELDSGTPEEEAMTTNAEEVTVQSHKCSRPAPGAGRVQEADLVTETIRTGGDEDD